MARTRIKICGVRTRETAIAAADAGADAVGFMFHKASPRYIEPDEAFDIMAVLPPFVASVGVFVDAPVERFMDVEEACPTDYAQLHGDEDEETAAQCGPRVIKAIRYDAATIAAQLARWGGVGEVDAVLIDGSAGGEGKAFDWNALRPALDGFSRKVIVAGGLSAENVGDAIRAVRPWAVDVSSGVESGRAVKDPGLIEAFCRAVRRADSSFEG